MDRKNKANVPALKRSLSSLSSQITSWSTSRSCSPARKKSKRSSLVGAQELERHNLTRDLVTSDFNTVPWYENYSPRNVTEVSIHKKKLKEVHHELDAMLQNRSDTRILLLTGPSGCCKSTVVDMLGKDLVPRYRVAGGRDENVIRYENDMSPNGVSHKASFGEFLSEVKYRVGSNLSLVLVEDIPNVSHTESRNIFQRQLLEWLYLSKHSLPPLIISLTECELENCSAGSTAYGVDYSWTAETILGKEILSHPRLKRVKFNPVNATLMKKTLIKICYHNKDSLRQLNKWKDKDEMIDKLAHSTGDLRSGIAMLQFWATSTRSTSVAVRESTTPYFHAVGRILHGSHEAKDDNEMINELLDSSKNHLSHQNFPLGILENYPSFNRGKFSISTACKLTDALSESNTLNSVPGSLEYCLRKVRHTLGETKNEGHSHGRPKFPREWRINQLQNEFKIECEDYNNVSVYKYQEPRLFRNIALHFAFFDPKVKKARYYRQKALAHYKARLSSESASNASDQAGRFIVDPSIDTMSRLGGDIMAVESQDTETCEEDHDSTARQSLDHLRRSRDLKLQKLLEISRMNEKSIEESDEEQFEEDLIIDSDEEHAKANFGDTLDDDDSIFEILTQGRPNQESHMHANESLSDSDLEVL